MRFSYVKLGPDAGANVRASFSSLIALTLLFSGCRARNEEAPARPQAKIESVFTSLDASSCKQEVAQNDPDGTPYLVCPGVEGYQLIVRQVDSGRTSIDIMDASRRVFPLNYQEFVTRRMFSLGRNAEWRVASRDGKRVPIALIVRVLAHESNEEPEKVTQTYFAVAKITPERACVAARISEGSEPETEVRSAADSGAGTNCLPPQPPMTAGGVLIR
jgi:hypothetical protein